LLEKAGDRTVDERELNAQPFSAAELDALIGKRDYLGFLNPRNELYRERKMKERPPTRTEALKLMADTPNLIKRPLLFVGDELHYGFDEKAWAAALKR
jgi:arsenate reductase-like glutaredoxin family protein